MWWSSFQFSSSRHCNEHPSQHDCRTYYTRCYRAFRIYHDRTVLQPLQRRADVRLPNDENAPIELSCSFTKSMRALICIEGRMFSPVEVGRIVFVLTLALTLEDTENVQNRDEFIDRTYHLCFSTEEHWLMMIRRETCTSKNAICQRKGLAPSIFFFRAGTWPWKKRISMENEPEGEFRLREKAR